MLRLAFASGERPLLRGAGREVNAWRDGDGGVFARLFVAGARRSIDWAGVGVFAFEPGADVVTFWPDPGSSAEVSADVFCRAILPAALQALGYQALHASAVNIAGSALVLCGRSGSGKSTVAYALARAGHAQLADDAVVLDVRGPQLTIVPLPFEPRLRPPSRDHFRDDTRLPHAASGERVPLAGIVELEQSCDLDVIDVVRVRPAEAFSVVLAHGHAFNPTDVFENLRLSQDYLRVVSDIPVWRVRYAPGLDKLADLEQTLVALTLEHQGIGSLS